MRYPVFMNTQRGFQHETAVIDVGKGHGVLPFLQAVFDIFPGLWKESAGYILQPADQILATGNPLF